MAEKITEYCWATPKCGLSWAHAFCKTIGSIHLENFNDWGAGLSDKELYRAKDPHYKFIVARNPYSRLVSFYINKVIFANFEWSMIKNYELPKNENLFLIPPTDEAWVIPHWKPRFTAEARHVVYSPWLSNQSTFEDFIEKLFSVYDDKKIERHLKRQSFNISETNFNRVVKLESLKTDLNLVFKDLDKSVKIPNYIFTPVNRFPKSKSLQSYVGNLKPNHFYHCTPPTWEYFYNDSTKDKVYQIYEEDFKRFKYEK
jgi:hypothetical protein